MIGFAAPFWLTALALVPIIRWLHRRSDSAPQLPVAHLALWNTARPPGRESARKSRTYDPAWIRRAAIVAAVTVALSGPQFSQPSRSIVVWIDHSLSMQARDRGRSRLEVALDQLDNDVAARRPAHLALRSLANPALGWTTIDEAREWLLDANREPEEPDPPPGSALDRSSEHWVVTDGADESVDRWIEGGPVSHLIRAGEVAENVAVVGIGARRSPAASGRIVVQARIFNAGEAASERDISLGTASQELAHASIALPPGKVTTWQTEVESLDSPLHVRLSPPDVLSLDDVARLDATPLRRRSVALDAECGAPLRSAIGANAALAPVAAGAEIRIICGAGTRTAAVPAIVVDVPRDAAETHRHARWSWSLPRPLPWPPGARTRAATPAVLTGADDRVLLSIDDLPVIVRRGGRPTRIDVSLDLDDPVLGRTDGYALAVAGLVESLVGENLIDPIAVRARPVAATRIRPLPVPAPTAGKSAVSSLRVEDFSRPALLIALALLGWDLLRQMMRLRSFRRHVAA